MDQQDLLMLDNTIVNILINSLKNLNSDLLAFLPNGENIIYNEVNFKQELIAELKRDFKRLGYSGEFPLYIKRSKCNYCYPNNKTYSFHNPKTDELVFNSVVDKVDEKNYIILICENKPKLNHPTNNEDIPF